MDTSIRNEITKGYNLLVTGLLSFVGIGLVAEFFREPEWIDKSDDIIIVGLAIFGVIWYFTGQNRYKLSWLPISLLAITSLVKIVAVITEFKDTSAAGDDFGLVVPLVVLTIITGISVIRYHRKNQLPAMAATSETTSSGD